MATREELQQQLKKVLPGSRRAKEIKRELAALAKAPGRVGGAGRSFAKPKKQAEGEISSRFMGLGGMRAGAPATPDGPTLFDIVKGAVKGSFTQVPGSAQIGGVFAKGQEPKEQLGPPEAPEIGEPPTPAVEPAAPPRGAAPVGAGAPPQVAPEEDPDQAILPFLAQAEQTPELAAFKALLEAPAPTFEKAAFSTMERAMLGLLAGLRGTEATLPIIEMRRQDARRVYQSAREVRAERLSGLFQAASIAEQQKTTRFAQRMAGRRDIRQERLVDVAEEGLALRQKAAGPQLQLLSSKVIGDFAAVIGATAQVRDFELKFIREGMPGGKGVGLIPTFLRSDLQKETAADLQAIQQPILATYLGAVRSIPELEGISSFVAPFGSSDKEILVSVRAIQRTGLSAIRTEIRARKLAGFDTSGIEQLMFENGFSGAGVQPSLIPTLPPHLGLDQGEVLADEGAF
jgi:hypothetical protein